MKTVVHKADSRGFADHDWLQANHSFSFANFHDPTKMHFGALRVLNDDVIAPKMGFATHPHNNMEIITIPLKGILKHRDNIRHKEWQQVLPGEVQIMSAGTGVEHSEINGSEKEHLSLFQIWIIPNKQNVAPNYDQRIFNSEERKNKLQTVVSSIDSEEDGLKIHQNAKISRLDLSKGMSIDYSTLSINHGVYIMNISGNVVIDDKNIELRDAIGVSEIESFSITANKDSELILIEVPMH